MNVRRPNSRLREWPQLHQSAAAAIAVVLLLSPLALAACSSTVKTLREAKVCHDRGDFECAAAVNVTCAAGEEGCNQIHLLKGDACLQLARRAPTGDEARPRYACAAEYLAEGIDQTEDWSPMGEPIAWSINLLEALREWQDLETGDRAQDVTRRLLDAALAARSAHPDHPAPVYYEVGARYAVLQPQLVSGENPDALCDSLTDLRRDVESAAPSVSGTALQANFAQLRSDLEAAAASVPDCR